MKIFCKDKFLAKDSENTGLEMKSLEDGVSFKLTPANDVFEEMRKAIHQGIVDGVMNQPYDIHISSDGKTTTANFYVDGKIVRHAEAKCHPSDRFNFKTGAEVAFERLWEKKPEEKKSVDLNNLKPGDKVRVRKDLKAGSWPGSILMVMPSMEKLAGKVVIIESAIVYIGDPIYTIKDFEDTWHWTPEMFEEI